MAVDILEGKVKATGRVVMLGGGEVGLETAEYLAERNHKVTVIEMLPDVAPNMPNYVKHVLLLSLRNKQVGILTRTRVVEITDTGVIVEHQGQKSSIEADTVVVALGAAADNKAVAKLKGLVARTRVIGDCAQPRGIREAIREGYEAAAFL